MQNLSNAALGFAVGFALSASAVTIGGCAASAENAERAAAVNDAIAKQEQGLADAEARQRAELEAAQAADDKAKAEAAKHALDEIERAKAAVAKARQIAESAINPDGSTNPDAIIGAASTAAVAVNPLLGVGVLLAGPVITGLIAERRRRKVIEDAANIVRSVDAAKAANPKIAEGFRESADILRAVQSGDARRLVDAAQGKGQA